MSKLEELIKELCPDGYDYKALNDVCAFQNGFAFNSNKFKETGLPILRITNIGEGSILDNGYVYFDESDYSVDFSQFEVKYGGVVVAMSGATTGKIGFNYSDTVYYLNQRVGLFRPNEEVLNNRFLFHVLSNMQDYILNISSGTGAQPNLSSKKMMETKIPVPPIEVQEEIVRILDNFTELTSKLTSELTSELTARKKQYKYYRDKLLSFEFIEIEWKYLNQISTNCDSQRKPVTSSYRSKGNIPYYGASGVVDYVDNYIFDGDYLLISEDGANLIARNTPIAFSIHGKAWVNNHAHILKFSNDITKKYVEYYINSIDLSKYISGAAQPKLNQENLNKIPIPYPSLEVQERIVHVLDNFDTICSDLNIGLPAEIEARNKQYEYYRDRLLSFNLTVDNSELNGGGTI